MQELKVIHSEFIGLVDIIAVDITPTVSLDELVNFGETQDYPWLMGRTSRDTLQDLEVLTQSTKIGIEADGKRLRNYRSRDEEGIVDKDRLRIN